MDPVLLDEAKERLLHIGFEDPGAFTTGEVSGLCNIFQSDSLLIVGFHIGDHATDPLVVPPEAAVGTAGLLVITFP